VQRRVFWPEWRDLHGVLHGPVQVVAWAAGVHTLCQRDVLVRDGSDNVQHLLGMSWQFIVQHGQRGTFRLSLCFWILHAEIGSVDVGLSTVLDRNVQRHTRRRSVLEVHRW